MIYFIHRKQRNISHAQSEYLKKHRLNKTLEPNYMCSRLDLDTPVDIIVTSLLDAQYLLIINIKCICQLQIETGLACFNDSSGTASLVPVISK